MTKTLSSFFFPITDDCLFSAMKYSFELCGILLTDTFIEWDHFDHLQSLSVFMAHQILYNWWKACVQADQMIILIIIILQVITALYFL